MQRWQRDSITYFCYSALQTAQSKCWKRPAFSFVWRRACNTCCWTQMRLQTCAHTLCLPQTHFSCWCSLRSESDTAECQLHWQAYARTPFFLLSLAFSLWWSGMLFLKQGTEEKLCEDFCTCSSHRCPIQPGAIITQLTRCFSLCIELYHNLIFSVYYKPFIEQIAKTIILSVDCGFACPCKNPVYMK